MQSMKISYEQMRQRELKLSEILFMALDILKERFGAFLGLSFLVTLPASAIIQFQAMGVTETEDPEVLLQQLAPVAMWTVGLSFFLIIGTLVATVLTKNAVMEEPRMSFSTAFYQGISKWFHGASALLLMMLRLLCFAMIIGILIAVMPILVIVLLPIIIGVLLYYAMMQECIGITAALRYRSLWNNVTYSHAVFGLRMGKGLRVFVGIYLIGMLPSRVIGYIVSYFLMQIPNALARAGGSVVVDSLLGLFTLFVSIGTTVLYMNREAMALRRIEEKKNTLHKL